MRPCTVCGRPRRGGNCPEHRKQPPRTPHRHRKSRQERGYNREYEQARRALYDQVQAALLAGYIVNCSICLLPIARMEDFSAEHSIPLREGGDHRSLTPAHRSCNSSRRRAQVS
jgi:5-methylcytosine-specific restriction endonuclease McrA